MNVQALVRIAITVTDLEGMARFYTDALGFAVASSETDIDPALARLLGANNVRSTTLSRGAQVMELAALDPPGAPYPADSHSNDLWFQHCALVTDDIGAAYARVCRHPITAISRNGPQTLPGGIVAFKFRDPEGHPLELIQFPQPNGATMGGIDHSAISVADAERSKAFYTGMLGLTVGAQQVNTGPAQDAMDGLDDACADVVALQPAKPAPHVELLGYRTPPGRPAPLSRPADIVATRLVLQVDDLAGQPGAVTLADGSQAALIHDPDGHALLLLAS